jgi:hypothetical protein
MTPISSDSEQNFERSNKLIDPLFQFHRLNEDGIKKAEEIAATFTECLRVLKTMCPEGREFAIVKTKLEEASFFAKKSIANVAANQA